MRGFIQKPNNGLGNFIMFTPALRLIAKRKKRKVNVFFRTKGLAALYEQCPFIKISPSKNSGFVKIPIPKKRVNESDTQAYCRVYAGVVAKLRNLPPTYVDSQITMKLDKIKNKKHVAVFHGCLGNRFKNRKDIGAPIRQYLIDKILQKNMVPVLLGSESDRINYWSQNDIGGCVDYIGAFSLRNSVSLLAQCDFFMSNDTGLYHVAGALKKPGLVLWKRTDSRKNMAASKNIIHIINRENDIKLAQQEIDKYLS